MSEDAHNSDNLKPEEPENEKVDSEPDSKSNFNPNSTLFQLCKGRGSEDDAEVLVMDLESQLTSTIRTSGFMGLPQHECAVIQAVIVSIGNFFALMDEKWQKLGFHIFGLLYASYLRNRISILKEKVEKAKTGKMDNPQQFYDVCLMNIKLNDGWREDEGESE